MINNLCFFEIPGDDIDALKDFYGSLFNWTFKPMPGPWKYYEINTGHQTPRGGLTRRQDPDHTLVNYVKVEAIQSVLETAVRLGARVLLPKWAIKGVGWFAVLTDPQGNRFGLWEDDPSAE